ncbi:MAG TPA: hypothetical protein VF913_14810 [Xanthobacteraceae bacterium]
MPEWLQIAGQVQPALRRLGFALIALVVLALWGFSGFFRRARRRKRKAANKAHPANMALVTQSNMPIDLAPGILALPGEMAQCQMVAKIGGHPSLH